MSVHDFPRNRPDQIASAIPLNIEAEQGVLGAMLLVNNLIEPVASILRPEHFSEEIHRRIFDIAVQLRSANKPASPVTVRTYLGDADLGGGMTIPQYLARLAAEATAPLLAADMAREVRDLAARRDLIGIGEKLVAQARHALPRASSADLAAESLVELQRVAELSVAADTRRDAGACASALIERARAIARGERLDEGVSTGLPSLDRATGGFQPGTLWIVAGRPRMGKTILSTGFALKVAKRAAHGSDSRLPPSGSQIFSLEVTEDQIIARLLADLAYVARRPVTFGDIMRGAIDEDHIWAIEEAQRRLADMPLALDVAPSLTVLEIGARVRAEKARMAKRGVRLAVVFVDYMKFVRATDRYKGNRTYEVGEITRGLKELAKAENLSVVLLAQVNRAVDHRDRKDRAPGLSDLRESGDLEADADVVVFIDRESVRIKQSPEYRAGDPDAVSRFIETQHSADLIVAKTRTGSETTVPIWIDAGSSTFAAQDWREGR